MRYSRRRSRRLRNLNEKEPASKPFFGKSNDTAVQMKEDAPFFQAKLKVGKPGDKYEQEADAVADAVVNRSQRAGGIQKKESETIQRADLATPLEEEKLSTAEQKLEQDKDIQEKPDLQAMDKEEEAMQMQAEEEEEMAQMQAEEEEEPMQMQAEEEEEMAQMQAEEEEEPMQMQAEEEEEMAQMQAEEEEEPMQMQAEEEEEMAQMQAEEEEEPMQMQAEEEEEMAQMKGDKEEEMEAAAVQTKRNHGAAANQRAAHQVSKKIGQKKGEGRPLPKKTRAEMERAFGVDFSGVNIHTGQDAVQMNKALRAQAFASGKDIFFNTGKFNPENTPGKHLLAHELTHVVQQNELPPKASGATPVHRSSDEALDWYRPWIRVATYNPGDTIGYTNLDLSSLRSFSTGWRRDAVSTGLLAAVAGIATAVAAKRLGLPQLLSLIAGGASAYARGHQGYHVKERIRGRVVDLHEWYGRYKYNLFTNELLAVDFHGIGPNRTSLAAPYFFEEAIMDANDNLIYVHTNEMTIPGVDISNHTTLPERSFGTI